MIDMIVFLDINIERKAAKTISVENNPTIGPT